MAIRIGILCFFISLFACNNNVDDIDANHILASYQTTVSLDTNLSAEPAACLFQSDTIFNNLPYNYTQAIKQLIHMVDSIDQIEHYNRATKEYLSALVLADFVYAVCSFQFLGSQYQQGSTVIGIPNWSNLSLQSMFGLANTNQVAVWCGDRTSFYIKLLDSVLHLSAQTISIPQLHTFPVVRIGNKSYIIDPFNPIVLIDSATNKLAEYYSLKKTPHTTLLFKKSPRFFGESKGLITQELMSKMGGFERLTTNFTICNMVKQFLLIKMDELLALRKSKRVKLSTYKMAINPVANKQYPFALRVNLTEQITNEEAFFKQYGLYHSKFNVN
jgi:hypothetical protein